MNKPTDIVDAEFEMLDRGDAPAPAKASPDTALPPGGMDDGRVQLGAFGDAAQPAKAERMSLVMFTTVALLASFVAFGVGAAYAYLAAPTGPALPMTASDETPVTANQDMAGGLLLHDLSFETGVSNGREYMSVEGVVVNESDAPLIIPPLRLLFGPEGQPKARYRIDRGETLKPGEQIVFTSRIPLRDTDPIGATLEFIR